MDVKIQFLGVEELIKEVDHAPEEIHKALRASLNTTAKKVKTQISRRIAQQIALSPTAITQQLKLGDLATGRMLRATIESPRSPNLLADFVVNTRGRGQGVNVSVKPGTVRSMPRAFLITVKGHKILVTRDQNTGGKKPLKELFNGLYILYGPSTDQAFISNDGTGVAQDMEDIVKDTLSDEFLRLLDAEIFK